MPRGGVRRGQKRGGSRRILEGVEGGTFKGVEGGHVQGVEGGTFKGLIRGALRGDGWTFGRSRGARGVLWVFSSFFSGGCDSSETQCWRGFHPLGDGF